MHFYLAPMEEVTGFVFRNVTQKIFGPLDKYLTPFLVPTQKKVFKTKEQREIDPANNAGLNVVPQLLTNKSEPFLSSGVYLRSLGYQEVNLNLGCPSGTVVPKGRGSGFLSDPQELDAFFTEVFEGLSSLPEKDRFRVSVKTRIGLTSPEEFPALLEVFLKHPIGELTIHPRIQRQFYKGQPDLNAFALAYQARREGLSLVYNGDIYGPEDMEALKERFPDLENVMLGRGLVMHPGLVRELKGGKKETLEELYEYEKGLYEGYLTCYQDERNALGKVKEVWWYLEKRFPQAHGPIKAIKKATREDKYRQAVEETFRLLKAGQ